MTAADFDSDPIYRLDPDPTPGLWHVHALDTRIGHVQRHRSRWTPHTATGTRIGTKTYPTRAQAALQVVTDHHARHTRKTRQRRRAART